MSRAHTLRNERRLLPVKLSVDPPQLSWSIFSLTSSLCTLLCYSFLIGCAIHQAGYLHPSSTCLSHPYHSVRDSISGQAAIREIKTQTRFRLKLLMRGRRSERPHQVARIGHMTAKGFRKGSIDAGLDNAPFAPVVAVEPMQVAQIGAASSPLMFCPSLPTPRPMTTGEAAHRAGQ